MTKILTAKNLSKSYGNKIVIRDISLQIKQGEAVGLLGPNGAGKTTSFYMIVGLVKPDKGDIFIDNTDITNFAIHQRSKLGIGYLPQEASIFRGMTVEQNMTAMLWLTK